MYKDFYKTILFAIEQVGLKQFKKTSLFGSNDGRKD